MGTLAANHTAILSRSELDKYVMSCILIAGGAFPFRTYDCKPKLSQDIISFDNTSKKGFHPESTPCTIIGILVYQG
jgi:hypothetical protein